MSTFFDKLSGTKPQGNEINLAASRAAVARPIRREEPVKAETAVENEEPLPRHATAAQEPAHVSEPPQEEPAAEEEGELTVDIVRGEWSEAGTFDSLLKASNWAKEKAQ